MIPEAGVGAYIISFNDLIRSQCFTYCFYMEDSNSTFLDMICLLSKAEYLKHSDGKGTSRDPGMQTGSRKSGSRIQIFGPRIQDQDSVLKRSSERKRMGVLKESKYKAGAWSKEQGKSPFQNWGQSQSGRALRLT